MKELSLSNINNGHAIELFDAVFQKVKENINDPNTKATGVRKITLTVILKPNKDRSYVETEMKCVPDLQPIKTNQGLVTMAWDGNVVRAFAVDTRQGTLIPDEEEA